MARRRVGHTIRRNGRKYGQASVEIKIAKDLEKSPQTMRREDEISFYSREYPLESFAVSESASAEWAADIREKVAPETSALYEQFQQEIESGISWVRESGDIAAVGIPTAADVTDVIRQKAYEIGYGEIGFTRFDRRFIYESRRGDVKNDLPNAICLAVEQEYSATQGIPGLDSERAQGDAYKKQIVFAKDLVGFISRLGFRTQVFGPAWHFGPMIPLFVEAGLGQLGVNGQLLSPHFGSRARLQIILTDANVKYDKPVDFGIPKFCEICQVCFTRCPGRAIQGQRIWFRGVEKSKLIFKRCRPIMARYDGCGVCMKVCPIQKYGLPEVMEHYIETGEVLGKGTPNLENYELGDKGYFRVGKLPVFTSEFFDMPLGRSEEYLSRKHARDLRSVDEPEQQEKLWSSYREAIEKSSNRQVKIVDMGMDLAE